MQSYSDPRNPCFHAGSEVLLADSSVSLVRDLRRGEALTVAWVDVSLPWAERRRRLRDRFGSGYSCSLHLKQLNTLLINNGRPKTQRRGCWHRRSTILHSRWLTLQ